MLVITLLVRSTLLLRSIAIFGRPKAQYLLAKRLERTAVTQHEHAEAAKWYRAAADQGFAWAQVNLANMYAEGIGVPQDWKACVYWNQKAADQGDPDGAVNLGMIYLFERESPEDYGEGVHLLQRVADSGYAVGQYRLGEIYAKGRGVRTDDNQAAYWYGKAARQGYLNAQVDLGVLLDKAGPLHNSQEAVKWWSQAASEGSQMGRYNLACAYLDGHGVPQDVSRGLSLLRSLAEEGLAPAQVQLGLRYYNALSVPRDLSEAYFWVAVAAENKDADPLASGRRDWMKSELNTSQVAEIDSRVAQWFASHRGQQKFASRGSRQQDIPAARTIESDELLANAKAVASGELVILRTERSYAGGGWTPTLIVRNQSVRPMHNVDIPISTIDENGIMREVGSALFQSIPAQTTVASTCCINTLQGDLTIKTGMPTFR